MYIIGQEHNIEIINKLENLPNFVIIQGDRHMGKSYFTFNIFVFCFFAKYIKGIAVPVIAPIKALAASFVSFFLVLWYL